jgi:predicted membrane-bound spermidine synthase
MLGHTAGLLYGADLLGGFLGGLFGGILLLPILGLKESCFMMAMIKLSSGILFLLSMKLNIPPIPSSPPVAGREG